MGEDGIWQCKLNGKGFGEAGWVAIFAQFSREGINFDLQEVPKAYKY
jgi:hypothetical protein